MFNMSSEHFSADSDSVLLTSDHLLPFTDISQHVRSQDQHVRSQETPLLSHASDPMYYSMKINDDCETMKVLLHVHNFASYEQSYWPKKIKTVFIITLHIHDIRSS